MSSAVRRLLAWIRPFWKRMALASLLGLLTVGSGIALMATSAWLIARAALQPSIADLGVSVVGVRFFGISRGLLRYLERLLSHDTTFRLLAQIRVWLYRAIEPLAPARLASFRSGDLLARVSDDVDALQNVYLRALAPPLVALGTAGLLGGLLAYFDTRVALAAVALFVVFGGGTLALAWFSGRQPARRLVQERAALNASLVDTLQGMADLVAFGAAARQIDLLAAQSELIAASERRLARVDAIQAGLMVLFPALAALVVLLLAASRVDGIYLALLALATLAAYEAILPLGPAAAAWNGSLEAARRLFELTDAEPAVADPPAPAAPPAAWDLVLEGVTFRYAPDLPPVFERLDLQIAQGERVAIMGENGSGKSTLAHLLARFWEIEAGSIRLGGVDLRALPAETTRALIGLMAQETYLFNTTIRENIRLARAASGGVQGATDDEVAAAAQAAALERLIDCLPQGYETVVGENGARLSGGERQRIGLARILLKNAPIWILDEATVHLDAVTESELIDSVLAASAGRTLIVLTHNPAIAACMERVILLVSPKHSGPVAARRTGDAEGGGRGLLPT